MTVSVEMLRPIRYADPRAPLDEKHVGLLLLYSEDVRSRDDFQCAPAFDSFRLENVQEIGKQLQSDKRTGMAGEYIWHLRGNQE